MIVVVADTSPLNYLVQISCQDVLPALYGRILVPNGVIDELRHMGTPAVVRKWLRNIPDWLVVREIHAQPRDPKLAVLDLGEREAIQLAHEERADLLLMDEKIGVRLARRQGLAVTGTLGVLVQGAQRELLVLDSALEKLKATDFRCAPKVYEQARQMARKKGWNV